MNLIQYISFSIDKAIKMLMDGKTSKTEIALFLMDFKKILNNPENEILDGDFKEVEIFEEVKKYNDKKGNFCRRRSWKNITVRR